MRPGAAKCVFGDGQHGVTDRCRTQQEYACYPVTHIQQRRNRRARLAVHGKRKLGDVPGRCKVWNGITASGRNQNIDIADIIAMRPQHATVHTSNRQGGGDIFDVRYLVGFELQGHCLGCIGRTGQQDRIAVLDGARIAGAIILANWSVGCIQRRGIASIGRRRNLEFCTAIQN